VRKKSRKAEAPRPIKDRPASNKRAFTPSGPIASKTAVRGTWTALGYHAVTVASRDGRFATAGAGDFHMLFNRTQLQNQAREFSRDNGLFQGMIDKAAGYIVGTGFGFQARSGDPEWDKKAETWRKAQWERPEVSGQLSGVQVEELVARELLTMGDTGILLTDIGRIQLIESEQIAGPTLKDDGLKRDVNGRITGYYLAQYSASGQIQVSTARFIAAENFLYLLKADRPSSKRAVPPLQAAFAMLHRINDTCDSEARAWQLLSRFAVIFQTAAGAQQGLAVSTADPTKTAGEPGNVADRISDTDIGIGIFSKPGEEVKGIERNIPGKDFPASLTMFLRLLGLPLGLPLEIILLDWTKSNYSQSRAVLEQAYQSFVRWQSLLEQRFYRPHWRWMVDLAIANGELPEPSGDADRYAHEWIKPTFPWIDPAAEAEAAGAQLDRGIASYTEILKSKNKDREEVSTALEAETLAAIEIADRIFKKTGVRVPWQPFCGQSFSVNAVKEEPKDEKKQDPEPERQEKKDEAAAVEPPAPVAVVEPEVKEVAVIQERDEKGRPKVVVTTRKFREGA